jgi:phosphate starvation-inducible PhoH-like protein
LTKSYAPNTVKLEHLQPFDAITGNQQKACDYWDKGLNLILSGSAGTGKTFIAMNLALEEVLDRETPYDKLIIVRSIVPTRDIGYLPGDEEEKKQVYTLPYVGICSEIFGNGEAWTRLVMQKKVSFESTSFIRGTTFNKAIIMVDEMQNLNFHELDSVVTRVGNNCKLIMCGDYYQSDFKREDEKRGIMDFLNIVESLQQFELIEFSWKDIVRSDFVRDYIMTKEMLGIK